MEILRGAGLVYQWTLAVVYAQSKRDMLTRRHPWQVSWRPVLVFSRGAWNRAQCRPVSDTFSIKGNEKLHHPQEQPLEAWFYWLSRFTFPGDLVCDPYAGSATSGAAVKMLGEGRQWLGTEIDEGHYRVARGRLAKTREGDKP
jgi:DNA modification methylase